MCSTHHVAVQAWFSGLLTPEHIDAYAELGLHFRQVQAGIAVKTRVELLRRRKRSPTSYVWRNLCALLVYCGSVPDSWILSLLFRLRLGLISRG